jgi:hypothetical protein
MPTLNIVEMNQFGANSRGGLMAVASLPPLAIKNVPVSGANAVSAALESKTNMVRLLADVPCYIEVALAPVATTAKIRLAAGVPEYFMVPSGKSHKIAVIASS